VGVGHNQDGGFGLQAFAILFGVLFVVAVAVGCGRLLMGPTCDGLATAFVSGAAVLSAGIFVLSILKLAYPPVFLSVGLAVLVLGRHRSSAKSQAIVGNRWLIGVFLLIFGCYFILYFFNSMAPEVSPDGTAYHLGLVSRYLREHGFTRITWNMYASLSQGVEMLFLLAFAFGKHSAAAMTHFAFLLALVWQMFRYGQREGFPLLAACAALIVFASPVVGIDGTSAYNDVALAAVGFTLFAMLQRWDRERQERLLLVIGLLAGFCYAIKYTAALAVPYALVFVAWKSRRVRDVALVALCASLMVLPWMAKNWVWVDNPVSPFFNKLFPNPYITPAAEQEYADHFAMYDLKSRWQIPMEVTVRGSLSGLVGPVFLLSPLALLALWNRQGRRLLAAAVVFGAFYFSNIGTRFLIPPLPYVALAIMLAFSRVPALAVAVAVVHCVISWPTVIPSYSLPGAWRLNSIPWKEALRLIPEEEYLEKRLPNYAVARMVERTTPPGSTIFAFSAPPEAYNSRKILVAYQSADNRVIGGILWTAYVPQAAPTMQMRFSFPRQPLQVLRVTETNYGADLWHIHELRVYDGSSQVPRGPEWRLRAHPYSWGIDQAFDNSLVTFWICGEAIAPGQWVEVDFGHPTDADSLVIQTAPDQPGIRLRLEGSDPSGAWKLLAAAPQVSLTERPIGLRRAAAAALKQRGIDYVLAFDGEIGADDFERNTAEWGIREVGKEGGAHLYRLP
jgi:hypothetical protein